VVVQNGGCLLSLNKAELVILLLGKVCKVLLLNVEIVDSRASFLNVNQIRLKLFKNKLEVKRKMVRDLPLGEITLRRYEKPYDSSRRELVRKVCLSLGLLQPGDSRDIVVDLLMVLEDSRKGKEWVSSFDIRDRIDGLRKEGSLGGKGLAESNIRRQLKRLRDGMLVDKQGNKYRLSEFAPLGEIFENKIEGFLIPQTVERIKEYLGKL